MENTNIPNNEIENKGHQLEVSMARFIRTQSITDSDEEISIASIIDLNDLKDLMIPFYQLTGLGIGVFDKNNRLLISEGWQKICSHFHQKHPESSKSCMESEIFFKKNFETNKAISYKCKNGLWDMAYPIYLDEEFLGSIYFGQYFLDTDKIDKSFFIDQAVKFNFNQEAYLEFLKNVPILNQQKIDSSIQLFVTILEKVANIGKL
ncbi:MAG: PocR ligand-binding domain-containing protein [Prolixibacteraceae bacterium]